ncbi:MAG: hypothetical protein KAR42_02385 [candidate division Zixibacteria bacterium]|nr:hypothetical protein [candidate division Zixibacteria bacterium]
MNIFEKLSKLDRRWVFLILAVVVIIALLVDFKTPLRINKEVQSVYDFMEALEPGDYIQMSIDYDPGTIAEMHPMTYAILEQAFKKDVKVIITALSINGPGMAEKAMLDIMDSVRILYGKELVYGEDVAFLGYKPYPGIVILSMGQNYRISFPQDYYGTPVDDLPIMKGIINYDDVKGVILITGTSGVDFWISYANGRYDVELAVGLTGVMAADYYQYLRSGQIFGLMGGMLGAAEYELLVKKPGPAMEAMKVQVWAHIVIIVFIIIGNIGYFISRRKGGVS